jgi:hypothetical protein
MQDTPRYACGTMCREHFEQRDPRPLQTECDECPNCIEERQKYRDRLQRDHTIDPAQPIGKHIKLTCKRHPGLFWTTKNIDYIGARSIFFASGAGQTECDCSVNELTVA